jgi:hypothetical protein
VEEANSETIRKSLHDWFAFVAYTRLTPKGAAIVIQTRWYEDDLARWLISILRIRHPDSRKSIFQQQPPHKSGIFAVGLVLLTRLVLISAGIPDPHLCQQSLEPT